MKSTYNILVLFIFFNLVGVGGLWYGITALTLKKDEENHIREQLQEEQNKSSKLSSLKKTLTSASVEREKLLQYMYDQSDESKIKFLSQIEQLGTSTAGALVAGKSEPVVIVPKTEIPTARGKGAPPVLEQGSIRFEFSVSGTWPQVFHVLRLVEEFPTRLAVKKFEVRTSSGGVKSEDIGNGDWAGTMVIDLLAFRSIQ